MQIWENDNFVILKEQSEIPWLKIFTKFEYKELGDMPKELRLKLFEVYDIVEEQMRDYYQPDKINLASFGNMLPRVHLHIMARFKDDSYFPNPTWGEKLRAAQLNLPDETIFYEKLQQALSVL